MCGGVSENHFTSVIDQLILSGKKGKYHIPSQLFAGNSAIGQGIVDGIFVGVPNAQNFRPRGNTLRTLSDKRCGRIESVRSYPFLSVFSYTTPNSDVIMGYLLLHPVVRG